RRCLHARGSTDSRTRADSRACAKECERARGDRGSRSPPGSASHGILVAMTWPAPVDKLWRDLEGVRADVLKEVEGLSQAQADWKPGERDWSVGEIVHHLTIAEIATGKLTTKLTREAEAGGTLKPFPADLREYRPLVAESAAGAEAPQVVWPERGKPIATLVGDMKATRERSRQS